MMTLISTQIHNEKNPNISSSGETDPAYFVLYCLPCHTSETFPVQKLKASLANNPLNSRVRFVDIDHETTVEHSQIISLYFKDLNLSSKNGCGL